jgi:hypothetical protein
MEKNIQSHSTNSIKGSAIIKPINIPLDDIQRKIDEYGLKYTFDSKWGGYIVQYNNDRDREILFDELEPELKEYAIFIFVEPDEG